jgi:translin
MLDKEDFKEIQEELKKADQRREETIQLSRSIIKESKLVIYAIHRGDKPSLDKISTMVKELKREHTTGIENVAVQEYVEAVCFYYYIFENKLPTRKELEVDSESYLLGLCDLTGELMRRAVKDVIEGKKENALKITKVVEEIYGEFLQFDLRNGELRKKSDSIKWNLQKLEQLSLDIVKK